MLNRAIRSRFWTGFLSWILPETGLEKVLAGLSAEEFKARVSKNPDSSGSGLDEPWLNELDLSGSSISGVRAILVFGIPVFSVFSYKNELVRQAIWLLKYRGSHQAARIFGECLANEIARILSKRNLFSIPSRSGSRDLPLIGPTLSPILVPLPMSPTRRKERGWNQTEMIAAEIMKNNRKEKPAGNLDMIAPEIFIKFRHTKPQTQLSRAERLKNLEGSFAVTNPAAIKNRNIILIDDVMTTGASIREAAETLRRAGALKIIAFTVAG
jgi:ComF family protein